MTGVEIALEELHFPHTLLNWIVVLTVWLLEQLCRCQQRTNLLLISPFWMSFLTRASAPATYGAAILVP